MKSDRSRLVAASLAKLTQHGQSTRSSRPPAGQLFAVELVRM